jgi:hypothetical protein
MASIDAISDRAHRFCLLKIEGTIVPNKLKSLFNTIFGPPKPSAPTEGNKPLTPLDSTTQLPGNTTQTPTPSDIGYAIGAAGGNIADAAKFQFILSRVLPPGEKPTPDQIGKIVGMLGGGMTEAVIIDAILNRK